MAPPLLTAGESIAAPWVSTPAFLQDRARGVHDALTNLNEQIDKVRDAGRLSRDSGRYKAWKRLLDRWQAWYGDTSSTTWLWSGTDATLESYEGQVRDWQAWYRMTFPDASAELQTPPPNYRPPYSGKPGELPFWFWLLAAGGGAFVLWRMTR